MNTYKTQKAYDAYPHYCDEDGEPVFDRNKQLREAYLKGWEDCEKESDKRRKEKNEVSLNGWAVRLKNDELEVRTLKPAYHIWEDDVVTIDDGDNIKIDKKLFKDAKWLGEPVNVEIIIRRKR